jgi:replication initiation and membrane attachment protein DnaB
MHVFTVEFTNEELWEMGTHVPAGNDEEEILETIHSLHHQYIAKLQLWFEQEREKLEEKDIELVKQLMIKDHLSEGCANVIAGREMLRRLDLLRCKVDKAMINLEKLRSRRVRQLYEWLDSCEGK